MKYILCISMLEITVIKYCGFFCSLAKVIHFIVFHDANKRKRVFYFQHSVELKLADQSIVLNNFIIYLIFFFFIIF